MGNKKHKIAAYITGIICCSYSYSYSATLRDNEVYIHLDKASSSISFGNVTVGKITATPGQPTDGATFSDHNQDNPPYLYVDIKSGRHGSHTPVDELNNEKFNTQGIGGSNGYNFMAPFKFDLKIDGITYTCNNLAFSQESSGGFNQWSIFAKSVDTHTGQVTGVGNYVDRYHDNNNTTLTCLSQGNVFFQTLNIHPQNDSDTNQFYISTSSVSKTTDNESNISFENIDTNLKIGKIVAKDNIIPTFSYDDHDSDGSNFPSYAYMHLKTPSNQYANSYFVQQLKSNGFNTDNFGQSAYLSFAFSFDIVVKGNEYTCDNVAEAETDGNGPNNKQWTLFAKQVDQTGKVVGSGNYTNQASGSSLSVYCSPTNGGSLKPIWVSMYPGGYRSFVVSL
jgi:hypothetical protein